MAKRIPVKATKAPADKKARGARKVNMNSPDVRFKDTVPLRKFRSKTIGIAGLGAVGRHVAILLGVMGHKKLFGADPDMIELKNVGTQGWDAEDVGSYKAQVVAREITVRERGFMSGFPTKFETQSHLINRVNVFFCCVDTMRARKTIWEKVTRPYTPATVGNVTALQPNNLQGLWLDSRMASRVIRILAVDLGNPEDRRNYEKTLFNDTEAFEGSCTDRMTVYGAYVASGLMVSQMVNWLNGMLINKDFVFETLAMSVSNLGGKNG